MKIIYFVTTSKSKYRDFKERIEKLSKFKLLQIDHELNEPQSFDNLEIARNKMKQARELFPNKELIVEDRGFSLLSLNGFPGPFIKPVLKSLGINGLLKLMVGENDRTAEFVSVLGYFDGRKEKYFTDIEGGFILKEKKGKNLRGWTDLLYIYGYKNFPNKSLAEFTDNEWNRYLELLAENDYLKQFLGFLNRSRH